MGDGMIKLNGVEIKPTIFPDGTSQVWKINESLFKEHAYDSNYVDVINYVIEWEFENETELFHVIQLRHLLDSVTRQQVKVTLNIPFLPYSRQDKDVSNDNTFAKISFTKILRFLDFWKINTLDIHSNDNQYVEIYSEFPSNEIDNAFEKSNPDVVCFPDKGSKDRYGSYFGKFPNCSFEKERDQNTGYIKNLTLNEEIDIVNKEILIIDDICDGGMTFKLTAEKLIELGAKRVDLYTTHGIYSKGVQTLKDSGISRIFNRKGEVE